MWSSWEKRENVIFPPKIAYNSAILPWFATKTTHLDSHLHALSHRMFRVSPSPLAKALIYITSRTLYIPTHPPAGYIKLNCWWKRENPMKSRKMRLSTEKSVLPHPGLENRDDHDGDVDLRWKNRYRSISRLFWRENSKNCSKIAKNRWNSRWNIRFSQLLRNPSDLLWNSWEFADSDQKSTKNSPKIEDFCHFCGIFRRGRSASSQSSLDGVHITSSMLYAAADRHHKRHD